MGNDKGQGVKGRGGASGKVKRAVSPRAENVRAVLYLKAKHLDALEELAKHQAKDSGLLRPDLSKAARTALDEWMEKRR